MNVLRISDYLTSDEVRILNRKSNLRAVAEVLWTWGWIMGSFCLVYFFPYFWTVVPALFIIGGKQLACAIIMHDAGHDALFRTPTQNRFFGNLFGAWPIFHNTGAYSQYHLQHHLNAGLPEDPDLLLTRGYPTSRVSLLRKFARDLSGLTGIKAFSGQILMHLGFLKYNLGNKVEWQRASDILPNVVHNLTGPLFSNAIILIAVSLAGAPWLYLLWIGAYLTTFQFSLRIRSMAEHSMVADSTDPRQNSRTVSAGFLEKLLFAPLHVNYHAEHHLAMSVPSYHLPQLRKMMEKKRKLDYGLSESGYWAVIAKAASKPGVL